MALLRTIAIVGGGFCGTVVAANLLRRPPAGPTRIVLVERSSTVGRGVAYADRGFPYLLNVPASRMCANAAAPNEFLEFVQRRIPGAGGEHLRALWDTHRHRLPLQLIQRVDELRNQQRLHIHAGHLLRFAASKGRIEVTWRPRGTQTERMETAHTAARRRDRRRRLAGPAPVLRRPHAACRPLGGDRCQRITQPRARAGDPARDRAGLMSIT